MFVYSDQSSVLSAQLVSVKQDRYACGKSDYTPMPSCKFRAKDGAPAVKLCDILQGRDTVLDDPNGFILFSRPGQLCREKISHRLRIIGFDSVYEVNGQVPASSTDSHNGRVPLMRRRVALHIAKSVQKSMKKTLGECWKLLGEDRQHAVQITFDRLYLLEMINVSEGSWQPILAYSRHPEAPPSQVLPVNNSAYGMGANGYGYANTADGIAAVSFVNVPVVAPSNCASPTGRSTCSGLVSAQYPYGSTPQQSAYEMDWAAYYTSASQSTFNPGVLDFSYGSGTAQPARNFLDARFDGTYPPDPYDRYAEEDLE